MRFSHGILALTITLMVAPVEFAAAHGGGSTGGGPQPPGNGHTESSTSQGDNVIDAEFEKTE